MKKHLYSAILIVTLLICNAVILNKMSICNKKTIIFRTQRSSLDAQMFYGIEMDEYLIDLSDYIKTSEPILCYFASELHCKQCVDSVFSLIKAFKEIHKIDVMLLADYKNRDDLNLFFRLNKFNGKVVDVSDLNCPLFDSSSPFLFMYHPEIKRISEVFRPEKAHQETTKGYLDLIYRKYYLQKLKAVSENSANFMNYTKKPIFATPIPTTTSRLFKFETCRMVSFLIKLWVTFPNKTSNR